MTNNGHHISITPRRGFGKMRQRAARPWARFLLLMVALLAVYVLAAPPVHAQTTPANYDGDGDGLIEIASLAQLNAVRWDLNGDGAVDDTANSDAYATAFPVSDGGSACPADMTCIGYELTASLDFDQNGDGEITSADSAYWNDGAGWQPIGANIDFAIVFEGNDHTIANLFVNRRETSYVGLFGSMGDAGFKIYGGEIRNLGMLGVDVTGDNYAGGLIGRTFGSVIVGCYATGTVRGDYDTGGLVGENTGGTISANCAKVAVNSRQHVGGLVGENEESGKISDSYATGTVNGDSAVGGLVGFNEVGSIISTSYATGTVIGNRAVGGLVGSNKPGTINASYSTGSVRGISSVGGLVGNLGGGAISASYSVSSVRGKDKVGGLVGSQEIELGTPGVISASYFDTQTSGQTAAVGTGAVSGAQGKTTAELQTPTAYGMSESIYAGWNLDIDGDSINDNPWHFGTSDQYPALQADFNGDERATWQEFGYQLRQVLRLTADTSSYAQVKLSWNEIIQGTNAQSVAYTLYRNGEAMASYDGRSVAYIDAELIRGQTYNYQVSALLNGVEAGHSNQVVVGGYDLDGDGLIEISSLAQLNAVRLDRNGDGAEGSSGNSGAYFAAFPVLKGGSVCPAGKICTGYELMANLDFDENGDGEITGADSAYWNDGAGWQPIAEFSGTFEGNGHTISNLFISRSRSAQMGLFRRILANGEIRNLGLAGVNVTGYDYTGGLAGESYGTISSSYSTGSISGYGAVGTLVGFNNHGTIRASYSAGAVNGTEYVGGLVGYNSQGTIRASYSTGAVSGKTYVGGLVGLDDRGTISASYYDSETSGRGTGAYAKTTAELQSPTGYTGIYVDWNLDLDGDDNADSPWISGTLSSTLR